MTLSLTLKKSANNEVRVRLMDAPTSRKRMGDSSAEKNRENLAKLYEDAYTEIVRHPNFIAVVNPSCQLFRKISEEEVVTYEAARTRALDIIHEFQQKKRRYASSRIDTVNRPVRFTRRARHTILEAGSVVARMSPSPECSTFVTLTLPGDTDAGIKELAGYSGYLCNRLTQVLRRQSKEAWWFYSWELQQRGALHLHFVVWHECPEESLRLGGLLRDKWVDCIKDIGSHPDSHIADTRDGKRCWLPDSWQNDVVSVNKCVASYISKYVSKGSDGSNGKGRGFGVGKGYPPKRWWGMSRSLLREVKRLRVNVRLENMSRDVAYDAWTICNNWIERFHPIKGYGYDFQVNFSRSGSHGSSLAGDSNKGHDVEGYEVVYYFDPSTFEEVEFHFDELVRYIASMQSRISAIGDVCKVHMSAMPRMSAMVDTGAKIKNLTFSGIMLA